MQIGMKIYYDKATGNILVNTGDMSGNVVESTREQDLVTYKILAERVPETIGLLKLEYKQHEQDFMTATGYRVNTETEKLEFTYDPIIIDGPTPTYQKPLSDKIVDLEARTEATETALLALLDMGL